MDKISLVLEGGGMRGIYTSGVLDFFLDKKLYFYDIFGVSAGACNAISYISRQRGRNAYVLERFCSDPRYISMSGLATRGSVFGMDFIFREIPDHLVPLDYDTYVKTGTNLTIVSTDCETGRPNYRTTRDIRDSVEYLIGSSSIPLFAKMVEVDGLKLLDGSGSESVPIRKAVWEGFPRHVVVLTRNAGYRKPKGPSAIYQAKYRNYPKLVTSLKTRYLTYNTSMELCEKLEREGNALIIRPTNPLEIDRFERNPQRLHKLYLEGYQDAQNAWEQLSHFCQGAENVVFGQEALQ